MIATNQTHHDLHVGCRRLRSWTAPGLLAPGYPGPVPVVDLQDGLDLGRSDSPGQGLPVTSRSSGLTQRKVIKVETVVLGNTGANSKHSITEQYQLGE